MDFRQFFILRKTMYLFQYLMVRLKANLINFKQNNDVEKQFTLIFKIVLVLTSNLILWAMHI